MSTRPRPPLIWTFLAGFLAGGLVVAVVAWCLLGVIIGPFLGPGWQDFTYDVGAGYVLQRTSPHEVIIRPTGPAYDKPTIGPKVVGLAWNDEFILARRQSLGPDLTPVDASFDYWILETRASRLRGPMDFEEFSRTRAELMVPANLRLQEPERYR